MVEQATGVVVEFLDAVAVEAVLGFALEGGRGVLRNMRHRVGEEQEKRPVMVSLDEVECAVGVALRQRGLVHRLLDDAVALAEGQRLEGGELAEVLPNSPFVGVVGVEKAVVFIESLTLRRNLRRQPRCHFPMQAVA